MSLGASSRPVFLGAGAYALFCCPAILIAERRGWPEWPFHITQLLATLLCFAGSLAFVLSSGGSGRTLDRSVAALALALSGAWLAFVVFVLVTFDLSGF